ncbi:IclR family transcriptional regulator [Caballeronia arationis]|jgi:DNA-binding IclR family transcriptional regulator|uniref:Transcriptional regulator, IclR family n=1 Tax=Caballeronia arationis TaxID=1777142 RepID=A0A7Z7N790_9BURK|nr:IclR family transcriptional regulator [Caballeronia arationis]SAL04668.1 IclR family transcriptional regulator [Caballeronia arationis]SOE91400.1 transcriptional regulator, IclR family [Caballeronia arationis]
MVTKQQAKENPEGYASGARKEQRGIQSMEVGGRFLQYLADAGEPVTLADLSARSGIPTNQVFTYMVSLLRTGLVKRDPVTSKYEPGPLSLRLGLHALRLVPAVRKAMEPALQLATRTEQSVLLATWGDLGPTVLQSIEPAASLHAGVHVGTVMSLAHSTTGRVFAAYKEAEFEDRLKADLGSQRPEGENITQAQFRDILADIRKRGLARGEGMPIPGINSISAPVFDSNKEIVLVLTLFGVAGNFDVSWKGTLASSLLETTRFLTEQNAGNAEPAVV